MNSICESCPIIREVKKSLLKKRSKDPRVEGWFQVYCNELPLTTRTLYFVKGAARPAMFFRRSTPKGCPGENSYLAVE